LASYLSSISLTWPSVQSFAVEVSTLNLLINAGTAQQGTNQHWGQMNLPRYFMWANGLLKTCPLLHSQVELSFMVFTSSERSLAECEVAKAANSARVAFLSPQFGQKYLACFIATHERVKECPQSHAHSYLAVSLLKSLETNRPPCERANSMSVSKDAVLELHSVHSD
jgi:hypothetical protein